MYISYIIMGRLKQIGFCLLNFVFGCNLCLVLLKNTSKNRQKQLKYRSTASNQQTPDIHNWWFVVKETNSNKDVWYYLTISVFVLFISIVIACISTSLLLYGFFKYKVLDGDSLWKMIFFFIFIIVIRAILLVFIRIGVFDESVLGKFYSSDDSNPDARFKKIVNKFLVIVLLIMNGVSLIELVFFTIVIYLD